MCRCEFGGAQRTARPAWREKPGDDSWQGRKRLEERDNLNLPARLHNCILALGPNLIIQQQFEYHFFPSLPGLPNPRGRVNAVERHALEPAQPITLAANEEMVAQANIDLSLDYRH